MFFACVLLYLKTVITSLQLLHDDKQLVCPNFMCPIFYHDLSIFLSMLSYFTFIIYVRANKQLLFSGPTCYMLHVNVT